MNTIYKHVEGINEPLSGKSFYKCVACMHEKPTKSSKGPPSHEKHKRKTTRIPKHKYKHITPQIEPLDDDIYLPHAQPGQHFHVDFGFVRGSKYTIKQVDNLTIT